MSEIKGGRDREKQGNKVKGRNKKSRRTFESKKKARLATIKMQGFLNKEKVGDWRGDSAIKNWLLFQRTQVQFLAPTWWLTTICNSSSREPDALF